MPPRSWAAIASSKPLRPEKPDQFANFFTLEALKQGGYLNIDGSRYSPDYSDFPIIRSEKVCDGHTARGSFAPDTTSEAIHPLFRRSQWDSTKCSEADYKLVEPSLLLVTRLLEQPSVLLFFDGLLKRPLQRLPDHDALGEIYTFKETQFADMSFDKAVETWKKLCETRDYLTLAFEEPGHGMWAKASGRHIDKFTREDGTYSYRSRISIKPDFLSILRGDITGADFAHFATLNLDQASLYTRTVFYLAEILLHEFCHSVSHIYFGRDAHTDATVRLSEPFFYGNQRCAEVGHAFEQFVFGGVCMPMSAPVHAAAPYGLCMRRFPGLMCQPPLDGFSRGSPAKWGVEEEVIYPVHMDYVAMFFDRKFWDYVVQRFGAEVFRYQRKNYGLKFYGRPVVGKEGFWEGETQDVVVDGDEPEHI